MSGLVVTVEGLQAFESLEKLPAEIETAMFRAVNKTADRTRTASAREIRKQVNFPASYLNPSEGRLAVTRRANRARPEATITARQRPTSLARFGKKDPSGGVILEVNPGVARRSRRLFMIGLANDNRGLAIRLRPGETIQGKAKSFTKADQNLYLLYGPSVDQVFRDVATMQADEAAAYLEDEFNRLLQL